MMPMKKLYINTVLIFLVAATGLASGCKLGHANANTQQTKAELYNNRRMIYAHNRSYDKAIEDYSEAIANDPKLAAAYFNRGDVYKIRGSLDKAIADYSKAIAINPKLAAAYQNRGFTYREKRLYDKAAEDEKVFQGLSQE